MLKFLLRDNGTPFVSKLSVTPRKILRLKHLTATAFHLLTNGQVKRYVKTNVALLQHSVAEHEDDRSLFARSLTYAYKNRVNRFIGVSTISPVLS